MTDKWTLKHGAVANPITYFSCLFALSCSSSQPRFEAPYKANVISFNSRTTTTDETWSIDTKKLESLEQPTKGQGKFFEIITGASIKINSTTGSLTVATSTTHERGDLRLENIDGIIVARDTLSLYAISAFYSFEQLFNQIAQVIPLSKERFVDEIGDKLKIFLQPSLVEGDSFKNTVVTPKTNAAFNPENNDFYLLKSSELEKIPLAANYKVIAHEFGHLIFKKAFDSGRFAVCQGNEEQDVLNRKKDKNFTGRWSLEYSVSGINEGYADFVSYMFTRSVNPLADAFVGTFANSQEEDRSLTGKAFTFDQLSNDSFCSGSFYCIGTLFARALYSISKDYEDNPEKMTSFSHRVYTSLGLVRERLTQAPYVDLLPLPSDAIAQCIRTPEINLSYDGSVNSAFLAAFVSVFPDAEEKSKLCSSFEELFGERGFNKEARRVCTL